MAEPIILMLPHYLGLLTMIRSDLGVGERDVLCILKLIIKLGLSSALLTELFVNCGFKNVIQMVN